MDEKMVIVQLKIEVEAEFPADFMECVEKRLKREKKTLDDIAIKACKDAIRSYGHREYILYLFEKGLSIYEISLTVGRHQPGVARIIKHAYDEDGDANFV